MSVLAVSVLMALPAAAAPMSRENVRDVLSREAKVDEKIEIKGHEAAVLHSSLSRVAKSSVDSSGLSVVLETNLGKVQVLAIAKAIDLSDRAISDSTKIANDKDAKASELLKAIEASNQTYAEGMSIVAGKLHDATSEAGQAVSKVLVMGREIARGNLDVKQAESYEKMMRAMTDVLKSGQARTSEEALDKGLEQMGMDKAQKRKELVSCQN